MCPYVETIAETCLECYIGLSINGGFIKWHM